MTFRHIAAGCATVASLVAAMLGVAPEAAADVPYPAQVTPGALRGVALHDDDPWPMGYWEYLPADYATASDDQRWPLLVFLGGIGQSDDESVCPTGTEVCAESSCVWEGLCRATRRGPMRLMRNGDWDDTARPYIFVSPQHNVPTLSAQPWDPDELDVFFQYILDNYPVDPRRMYMAGMSQGGRGVLEYVQAYPRRFTAIVPSPGGAVDTDVTCHFLDTAVWAFHGEDDTDANLGTGVFDPCWMARRIDMANHPGNFAQFPRCTARAGESFPEARMTMFYDTGHEAWIPANDPLLIGFDTPSWATAQDCFNSNVDYRVYSSDNDVDGIYTWFSTLDRPDVHAPDDAETNLAAIGLTAVVVDDDAVTYAWTQTAGPAATLSGEDSETLTASDLVPEQSYTFEVRVVDVDGQWDVDEVTIATAPELAGTTTGVDGATGGAASTGGDAGEPPDDPPDDPSDGSTGTPETTGDGVDPSTSDGASATGSDPATSSSDGVGSGSGTGGPVHESQGSWTAGSDAPDPTAGDQDAGCACRSDGGRNPVGSFALAILLLAMRRRCASGHISQKPLAAH